MSSHNQPFRCITRNSTDVTASVEFLTDRKGGEIVDTFDTFLRLSEELQRKYHFPKATSDVVARNMILGSLRSQEFDRARRKTTLPFSREQLQAAGIL